VWSICPAGPGTRAQPQSGQNRAQQRLGTGQEGRPQSKGASRVVMVVVRGMGWGVGACWPLNPARGIRVFFSVHKVGKSCFESVKLLTVVTK
jgi:hypothetical protein